MILARAISAFAILVFFSLFIFLNTKTIDAGSGYEFLALCMAAYLVLLVISGNLGNVVLWRIGTVLLLVFFVYFAAKFYVESESSFLTRQVMLGTTGGVVFAFFMGLVVAQALSTIYDLRNDTKSNVVLYLMVILYALMVLIMGVFVFQSHQGTVLSDRFLVEKVDNYQRVGDLFSMQFLAMASLICIIAVTSKRKRLTKILMPTLLLIGICAVYALTSQLLGSNKGLVVPIGILLVYLAVVIAGSPKGQRVRRTSMLNILFSGLAFKLLFASLLGLGALALVGETLLQLLGLESGALRITGYGTGEVASIDSRSELFSENFYLHFMHSPIFGNTQVELLTTGEGTYVHSTLSILTHLGLFGFVIFLCILIAIYMEISNSFRAKYSSIFGNQTYGLFRLLSLFAVLVMGSFSAFFTWMPLWFALGLYGNWFHQYRERSQLLDPGGYTRQRRRRRKSHRLSPGHR